MNNKSSLSEKTSRESQFDTIKRLPYWSRSIEISALEGGLTNSNFLVLHGTEKFVVRLAKDIPEQNIVRWHEAAATSAASAVGISPELVHHGHGVLVIRFIEGRTLSQEDISNPHNLVKIADLLRTCHQKLLHHWQGPVLAFWPFQVARSGGLWICERNHEFKNLWEVLDKCIESLEQRMGLLNLTFTHNDLLAANFIDDGSRLWLIDWEYAGMNSTLFDLAGLSANNDLDEIAENQLIEAYFDAPFSADLKKSFLALHCMSSLCELIWGYIQKEISPLDQDYDAYICISKRRLDAALKRCGLPTTN
jgi:thiamine kinase-like enzyme